MLLGSVFELVMNRKHKLMACTERAYLQGNTKFYLKEEQRK